MLKKEQLQHYTFNTKTQKNQQILGRGAYSKVIKIVSSDKTSKFALKIVLLIRSTNLNYQKRLYKEK